MTGSPDLILKKSLVMEICRQSDIDRFATKLAVDPKLVEEYVQHLNDLKQRSQMTAAQRGRKSQQLSQKTFEEYDWRQLVLRGEISKMKVFELDKYLDKHNLLTGKKARLKDDNVKCIISHVLRNDYSATDTNTLACASYKQRECVDESDKNDDIDDDDDDDDDKRSDSEEDLAWS